MEEVEDKAFIAQREPMGNEDDVPEHPSREDVSVPLDQKEVHHTSTAGYENCQPPLMTFPPPPPDSKPTPLCRKCQTEPGLSMLGISVLSTKGWVAGLDNARSSLHSSTYSYRTPTGLPDSYQIGLGLQQFLYWLITIQIWYPSPSGVLVES